MDNPMAFRRLWVREPRHSLNNLAEMCYLYRRTRRVTHKAGVGRAEATFARGFDKSFSLRGPTGLSCWRMFSPSAHPPPSSTRLPSSHSTGRPPPRSRVACLGSGPLGIGPSPRQHRLRCCCCQPRLLPRRLLPVQPPPQRSPLAAPAHPAVSMKVSHVQQCKLSCLNLEMRCVEGWWSRG